MNASDIVVTKNGNIIRGEILKYSDEELIIKVDESNTLTFKTAEIKSVDFDNNKNQDDKSNRKKEKGFGVLGVTFGIPGGINLTGGYYSENFGTRLNLGAAPGAIFAVQVLLQYPLYAERNVFFSPSIPIGYLSIDDFGSGTYSGFGIDMHIYGFTTFVGYGVGLETGVSGIFLFDIGYKYAWN